MASLPTPFAGPRAGMVARLIANGVGQALCAVAAAWLVHAALRSGAAPAAPLVLAFAVAGVGLAALRSHERVQAERLAQHHAGEVRSALFAALERQPLPRAGAPGRGAALVRFVGDLGALRRWLTRGVPRLAVGLVSIVIGLASLAWGYPALAAAVALPIATGAVAMAAVSRRVDARLRSTRRQRARLATEVADRLGAAASVQACGQSRRERRRIERRSDALAAAAVLEVRAMSKLRLIADTSTALAATGVMALGLNQIAAGLLSMAELAGALTLLGLLAPSARALAPVMGAYRAARVARERLNAVLDAPALRVVPGHRAARHAQADAAELRFDGVGVGRAIVDFSAQAPAGARIAIVGPNGAGKSTLLALAARQIDPDRGEVRLDGVPVQHLSLAAYRRRVAVAGPAWPLLRGSMARNLGYRRPSATDEERADVARRCGIDELLESLPRGGRTRLDEGGANLSAGQRQRVAWARALLGRPALLLLDEADAHLDPESSLRLTRIVRDHPGTVLMVTHSLQHLLLADEVWCIEGGRLVERGRPQDLLRRPGRVRALFGASDEDLHDAA